VFDCICRKLLGDAVATACSNFSAPTVIEVDDTGHEKEYDFSSTSVASSYLKLQLRLPWIETSTTLGDCVIIDAEHSTVILYQISLLWCQSCLPS
jgi:hypothetical protein